MNYESIGKEFSVTRERIRQIHLKGIRKMRRGTVLRYFTFGLPFIDAVETIRAGRFSSVRNGEIERLRGQLDASRLKAEITELTRIRDEANEILRTKYPKAEAGKGMPIQYLDLSVRTYNVCCRAGFDTTDKFIGKTDKDLIRMRNMGRKSMEELIDKLADCGIIIERTIDNG